MKAILNGEVIGLNEITEDMFSFIAENKRTLYNKKWYFNPNGAVIDENVSISPDKNYTLKADYQNFSGVEQWEITAEKQAEIDLLNGKKSQIAGLFNSVIDEINTLYPGLNITANDNIADVAFKMLSAGVEWADVDKYGARLKLLSDALNNLN